MSKEASGRQESSPVIQINLKYFFKEKMEKTDWQHFPPGKNCDNPLNKSLAEDKCENSENLGIPLFYMYKWEPGLTENIVHPTGDGMALAGLQSNWKGVLRNKFGLGGWPKFAIL